MIIASGVEKAVIEVRLPQLFPTMSELDDLTITRWFVQEGELLRPAADLLEVDAPIGSVVIPAPPSVLQPCRVIRQHKKQGEQIHLGDLLVSLQPER